VYPVQVFSYGLPQTEFTPTARMRLAQSHKATKRQLRVFFVSSRLRVSPAWGPTMGVPSSGLLIRTAPNRIHHDSPDSPRTKPQSHEATTPCILRVFASSREPCPGSDHGCTRFRSSHTDCPNPNSPRQHGSPRTKPQSYEATAPCILRVFASSREPCLGSDLRDQPIRDLPVLPVRRIDRISRFFRSIDFEGPHHRS
jgi:hypothetical protein